jgi:hypothetical protein
VKHVRKPILTVCAASLLAVPAAFAATDTEDATKRPRLVSSTVLDSHWKQTKRELKQARREARAKRRAAERRAAVPPQLQAIAQCESGGDPHSVSSSGTYRGKYQFSRETWAAVGGSGDPAAASEAEQDKRAAILYARSGPGQWPVCGS